MFARVAIYDIPGHRMDEAVERFREAIDKIDRRGLEEILVLRSSEANRAMTMSLWSTKDAMEASRVSASRLRGEAAGSVDGSVQSVIEFDVAIREEIGS